MTPRRRRLRYLRRTRLGAGIALTMGLAMLAGMTDAIGLMMIGEFVSFMSGNTTRFAASLAEGDLPAAGFLAAIILTFVAGNAGGELFIRRMQGRQALLLCMAAPLICAPLVFPGMRWPLLSTVFAMGMLNPAIDQVEGQAFGITFVTGALSRFGRGLGRYLGGERGGAWPYQIAPWCGMLLGGIAGALLHVHLGREALLAAAGFSLLLAGLTLVIPREWRRAYVSAYRPKASRTRPLPRRAG